MMSDEFTSVYFVHFVALFVLHNLQTIQNDPTVSLNLFHFTSHFSFLFPCPTWPRTAHDEQTGE